MNKIAILGANEFQNRLIEKAKKLGYETHVFAWSDGAIAKENADYFYDISITEKEKILKKCQEINIDAICTIATDLAMPTVNYVAEEMNLIGNNFESTVRTTDKYKMREALAESSLPIPKYTYVQNIEEFIDTQNKLNLNYPLIIKPVDRSGSRGIYKVSSEAETSKAIQKAKEVSFLDKILIEEFIDGDEYSVEMISQNGIHKFLQLTQKFTTGSPNFIETAHIAPPINTSCEKTKEIIETVKKSLTSLGVRNGASHSELKITANGDIKIIEIGARMGGDFIGSDMVEISTGIDFLKLTIDVALGEKINIQDGNFCNEVQNYALVKFIFDKKDFENFKLIKKEFPQYIRDYDIKTKEFLQKVTDSSNRLGYYILDIVDKSDIHKILKLIEEK